MRALEASLDLPDLATILLSLSFLTLDNCGNYLKTSLWCSTSGSELRMESIFEGVTHHYDLE
jgi:hypothetical protein